MLAELIEDIKMENENNAFETVDRASMEQNFDKLKEMELSIPVFQKRQQQTKTSKLETIQLIKNKFQQIKDK
jgi:hypothetical protein